MSFPSDASSGANTVTKDTPNSPLEVTRDGAVVTLRFSRPEALNAINVPMAQALLTTVRELAADASVRAVVLCGAGKGFMAGGDLATLRANPVQGAADLLGPLNEAVQVLATMNAPVIAKVHGVAAGAGLSLPLFDMGRNRANLGAAKAAREIAVSEYEKAIQSAFREVADALVGRATFADELAAQQAQAEAERKRFSLAELRYRNGVASYLDLLDAQRSLFAIEQALAQTRLAQRVSEVQLYKALGGGWSEP